MKSSSLAGLALWIVAVRGERSWISLPLDVVQNMTDTDSFYSHVDVLFGTPPQTLKPVINLSGSLLAAWSSECVFCAGEELFEPVDSTSLKEDVQPWAGSTSEFNGGYVNDTVGFGGVLSSEDQMFVLMETMALGFPTRMEDGHLGLWVNASTGASSIFTKLWEEDALLNPVIGMRFDTRNPVLTIGALNEDDYEGTINWVQVEEPTEDFTNGVAIDGIKGYNGSFLPFGDGLVGTLNSISRNIAVPPSNPYAMSDNYTGPQDLIAIYPDGGFGYLCNGTEIPYVALTVTINGVDYPVDSRDMLHAPSMMSGLGICNVALKNTTEDSTAGVLLGQPFLRSVYLAYRFPTDDCPGYYGFAFPKGANRTEAQISQQPTATPSLASKCLALVKPTSTPTPQAQAQALLKTGDYDVYGKSGEKTALTGIEGLGQTVWAASDESS